MPRETVRDFIHVVDARFSSFKERCYSSLSRNGASTADVNKFLDWLKEQASGLLCNIPDPIGDVFLGETCASHHGLRFSAAHNMPPEEGFIQAASNCLVIERLGTMNFRLGVPETPATPPVPAPAQTLTPQPERNYQIITDQNHVLRGNIDRCWNGTGWEAIRGLDGELIEHHSGYASRPNNLPAGLMRFLNDSDVIQAGDWAGPSRSDPRQPGLWSAVTLPHDPRIGRDYIHDSLSQCYVRPLT